MKIANRKLNVITESGYRTEIEIKSEYMIDNSVINRVLFLDSEVKYDEMFIVKNVHYSLDSSFRTNFNAVFGKELPFTQDGKSFEIKIKLTNDSNEIILNAFQEIRKEVNQIIENDLAEIQGMKRITCYYTGKNWLEYFSSIVIVRNTTQLERLREPKKLYVIEKTLQSLAYSQRDVSNYQLVSDYQDDSTFLYQITKVQEEELLSNNSSVMLQKNEKDVSSMKVEKRVSDNQLKYEAELKKQYPNDIDKYGNINPNSDLVEALLGY